MKLALRYSIVALVLALGCDLPTAALTAGADLAGVWKGTMDTQIGPVETTITVEPGTALAGKVHLAEYEGKIEKGKLEGDKISFEITIERGTITDEGTVGGDEMKLNVVGTTGNRMTLVAKRQRKPARKETQ